MLNLIIEKINESEKRLISYAEYIDTALYHSTLGYYMKDVQKIGKKGDFITTSNISNIFGRIMARWFFKQVNENQLTPAVCEIGAGNGRFANAFLAAWNEISGQPITYYIVETSPFHRQLQLELLPIGQNVFHVNHLNELDSFKGLIFSNELFDALPVHVVEMRGGSLLEVMIGWNGKELIEQLVPLVNPKILAYIEEQNLRLVESQRIEIPLEMESMVNSISKTLEEGLVVTIDYGYTWEEWQEPARRSGSLRGYHKHQMVTNVLLHPGDIDITHHIHFDSFISTGEKCGLRYLVKKRQDEFLLAAGILKELEDHYDPNPFSEKSKQNRAIRSLILPGMSSYFHVLIQQKGIELSTGDIFSK
ncbi:class I SAM-dependent methyltransferase [Pseudoneobacillus sp. C159]